MPIFENCYKNYFQQRFLAEFLTFYWELSARTGSVSNFFIFDPLSHPKQKYPKSQILNPERVFALSVILPTAHSNYMLLKVFQVQVCRSQQKHWVASGVEKSSWGFL